MQQKLEQLARALDNVSPLRILGRGYAIMMKGDKIIHSVDQVIEGDNVLVQLATGKLACEVEKKLD